jgi:hypothetical protein
MATFIRFILGNFTLTLLVIGLVASGLALLRKPKPLATPVVVEALFSYFLLFSIGFSFFYNFVLHSFLGAMTAAFIGWANSPFQAEVGDRHCFFYARDSATCIRSLLLMISRRAMRA